MTAIAAAVAFVGSRHGWPGVAALLGGRPLSAPTTPGTALVPYQGPPAVTEVEQLELLPPAALRSRLRVKIDRVDPTVGRSPLSRPISAGYEARVVMLGLPDQGPGNDLPPSVRARLPAAEHALFELALDQSLPSEPPMVTQAPGPARLWHLPGWVWLYVPRVAFGDEPALIVASDQGLLWAEVDHGNLEQDLAGLCQRSVRGPLPLAMWTWDGTTLAEATVTRRPGHRRRDEAGPTYVVRLPPYWAEYLDVDPVITTRFR